MGAVLSKKNHNPASLGSTEHPAQQRVNTVDASLLDQDNAFPYKLIFNASHYDFFIMSILGEPMSVILSESLLYLNFVLEDDTLAVDSLLLPSRQGVFKGQLFGGRLSAIITVKHVIRVVLFSELISSSLLMTLIDKYGKSGADRRHSRERLSPTYIVTPFYCPATFKQASMTIFQDVHCIFQQGLAVNQLTVSGFGKSVSFYSVSIFTSMKRLSVYATQHPHGKDSSTGSQATTHEALFRDTVTVMPLIWHRPANFLAQMAAYTSDISKYDVPLIRWRRLSGLDDPSATLLCSADTSTIEEMLFRRETKESVDEPALTIVFFTGTPYQMHWDLRFPHLTTAFAYRIIDYFEAIIHDAAQNFRQILPQENLQELNSLILSNRTTGKYQLKVRRTDLFTDFISRFIRVPLVLQQCIPQIKRLAEAPYTRIPQVLFDNEHGLDAGGLLKEFLVSITEDIYESGLLVCTNKESKFWNIAPECSMADLAICQDLPSATRITIYRTLGHLLAVSILKRYKFPIALSPALLFILMNCTVPSIGTYYHGEIQHSSTLMALKEAVAQFVCGKLLGRHRNPPSRYVSYIEMQKRALIANAINRGTVPNTLPDITFAPWSVGVTSISLHPYDALALYCLEMDPSSSNMEAAYLLFPDLAVVGMDECLETTLELSSIRTDANREAFEKLICFYRRSGHMFRNLSLRSHASPITLVSPAMIKEAPITEPDETPIVLLSDSSEGSVSGKSMGSEANLADDMENTLPRNKGPIYACHLAYSHMLGLTYYETCAIADGLHTLLRMTGINLFNKNIPVTYIQDRFYASLVPSSFTRELILRHFSFSKASAEETRDFVKASLDLTAEEQSSLLRFCTGVPYLEPDVLITVRFSLPKGYLPQGRTCSNTLELPMCTKPEELKQLLRSAIQHAYYGFL